VRGRLGAAGGVIETIVLTIGIFIIIQTFVAQPFQVQQHSMERTFEQGDYVLVDRLSHVWSPYARGQVIVFNPPATATTGKEPYIKRVIGIAGDTVDIAGGQVRLNGVALVEPYLYRDGAGAIEPTETGGLSHWVVPVGDLFVMGDHRQVSSDSRVFGPIPVASVIGRGLVRYWPLPAFGIVATPTYGVAATP
jgi:signal peptidase I